VPLSKHVSLTSLSLLLLQAVVVVDTVEAEEEDTVVMEEVRTNPLEVSIRRNSSFPLPLPPSFIFSSVHLKLTRSFSRV